MPDPASVTQAHLRILATSDLHGRLFAHDYMQDVPHRARSLQDLLPLIDAARSDAPGACVLVDNGDLIEGTALADAMAQYPGGMQMMASVMNAAGYDALGLGNHDFDFGLPVMQSFARALNTPLLSSNIRDLPWVLPSQLLTAGPLLIGIVSAVPSYVTRITKTGPQGQVREMIGALQKAIADLRNKGADVILGLIHTGTTVSGSETSLQDVARHCDIDLLVGGHTHERFPKEPGGLLQGTPCVIPGFGGEALGQIDAVFEQCPDGSWRITSAKAQLLDATSSGSPDHPTLVPAARLHCRVLEDQNEIVGHTPYPLNSYFTWLMPSRMMALAASAKAQAIEVARRGTEWADLPLLSCEAPSRAGGGNGPGNFADIPKGPLRRRHLAEFHVYQNQIWALPVTGSTLKLWLEKAVSDYARIAPDRPGDLLKHGAASFYADVIFGLEYCLDLTRPALFSPDGTQTNAGIGRITNLTYNGAHVGEDDVFLLAANSFRILGGGNFPGTGPDIEAFRPNLPVSQVIAENLHTSIDSAYAPPWRFAETTRGVRVRFSTGPGALECLDEIADFAPRNVEQHPDGFIEIEITL